MVRPRLTVLSAIVLASLMLLASPAAAYQEPNTLSGTGCSYCHPWVWVDPPGILDIQRRPTAGGDCVACHADYVKNEWVGPHGNYSTTSQKCAACHTVHDAPEGLVLLPAATVVGTCFTCHDGTGGYGVYGAIKQQTGFDPAGGHSYDTTSMVPGGDPVTGGSVETAFSSTKPGAEGTLICTDCHSPHGAGVVDAFQGDRRRVRAASPSPTTSKLLKQLPTGADTAVTVYGADWCLSCHKGRSSGGAVHNHPVDSLDETATPFDYSNLAILASDDPTAVTVLDGLGGIPFPGGGHWVADLDAPGNRGFLMPYPRSAQQSGHNPICQQCHEDSREVGELAGDGSVGDAATATISAADDLEWSAGWVDSDDNPAFQNFPHETQNDYMLVETDDDLCTNCHPVAQLP